MTSQALRFHRRNLLTTITAAAIALALSACSSSNQETAAPATAPAAAPATAPASAVAAPAVAVGKFAVYTAAMPAATANSQCALDTINAKPAADTALVAIGSDVVFGGWAGDGNGQAANGFLLVLKGTQSYSAPIATGVARLDVAKALSSDGMANSGYNLTASLIGVAAGNYTAYIVSPTDPANACATQRTFAVQ